MPQRTFSHAGDTRSSRPSSSPATGQDPCRPSRSTSIRGLRIGEEGFPAVAGKVLIGPGAVGS
jgi:hypothetical protein